jgi:HEAT repeat protein/tRNA A-37 threonylcarbamoyl transferase component Bud32
MSPAPPPSPRGRSSVDPLIGTQLGNFRVEQCIAQGGMGRIYRAVHTVIGRQAAIKVLTDKYSSDDTMIKRLHREARAVNRIGHPNIIDIFDFGRTDDDREYFVMEYLPGLSLAEHLEKRQRYDWAFIQSLFSQALSALSAAHDMGIVHRDIKPENILVSIEENDSISLKILDFGIAKSVGVGPEGEHLTQAGSVMGTPEYIAPEQIRGRPVDGRADLYAMGIVLYELVAGKRPYQAREVLPLLMAHLKEDPPDFDATPEQNIPEFLPAVIRKAMAKAPDDRYQDARAFAEAMGLDSIASATTPSEDPWRAKMAGDGLDEAASAAARAQIGQRTQPGVVEPTGQLPSQPAQSTARWLAPVALLLISLGAIAAYFATGVREKGTQAPVAKAPHSDARATAPQIDSGTEQAFAPTKDLRALFTQVRTALRQSLRHAKPEIRRSALKGIAHIRDPEDIGKIVQSFQDDGDRSVRSAAALALAEYSGAEVVKRLLTERAGAGPLEQISIDRALLRLGQTEGRRGLLSLLGSKKTQVALSAALALAQTGDARANKILKSALARGDELKQVTVVAVLGALAKLNNPSAVKSLRKGLESPRALDRLIFAEALLKMGDEEVLPVLRKILNSGETTTRLLAAKLLGSAGDFAGFDLMAASVRAQQAYTRQLAASSLAEISDRSALPPLAFALNDKNPQVKATAAEALARILGQMPSALLRHSQNWLMATLEHGDWSMRYAAVGVASEMEPSLAIAVLSHFMQDKDPRIRAEAAAKLGRLKGKTSTRILAAAALADASPAVRRSAVAALGSFGGLSARTTLASAIRDKSPYVRMEAASQYLSLGDARYVKGLMRAAKAKDAKLRAAATRALGSWKGAKATALLKKALKDRSSAVRRAAALELAKRGDRSGLAVLRRAAAGRQTKERDEALAAMNKLGLSKDEQAKTLTQIARSKSRAIRASAMKGAPNLGKKYATKILAIGARDSSPAVRRAAAISLSQLAGSSKRVNNLLARLGRDGDPAVRAAAFVGLAKLRKKDASVELGRRRKIAPAPLPKPPVQPARPSKTTKPLPSPEDENFFIVQDSDRVSRYKQLITRATLATQTGQYATAVHSLHKAESNKRQPAVQYKLGLAYLRWAISKRGAQRRRYATKAKAHFRRYLRLAPSGKEAKKAKSGLRDANRIMRTF